MNQNIETLKNSSAGDLICSALMLASGFAFPFTRNNKPDANTAVSDFINWLPIEAFLSNPALLAIGCFLAAFPIFGVKRIVQRASDESKGNVAGILTGLLFTAWIWMDYISA